ncbi:hypothetical protein [Pandoraea sp.]|uniref:hypothetical protein n=1 Tax=Pandoraea sp. TaxID=1883445 RepID=UPI00121BB2BE|nr:hypothetical protein [Pandoraea sp.]TAL52888.1 MAG: hypothetical protein EPN80_17750 [Pandoraea sp.]TAM19667.1 MAG: hypothetical protein EPN65_02735 [Pandoraea sp.]
MKYKAIAVAAMLLATGSAMAYPHGDNDHDQFSFSAIGNETNVLNNVAIFGLVGIKGCVFANNTANAVVQNDQHVWASEISISAPSKWLGNFTDSTTKITTNYTNNSVSDTGSAYLVGGVTTTRYDNDTSWVNKTASGHLNTSQGAQVGGQYSAGQQSSGSGGFIAGGGYQESSYQFGAHGGAGGHFWTPSGGGHYGYGGSYHASGGSGSIWGGYAYGQQQQSSGGFQASGYKNTQSSFDAGFHATDNHGYSDVESASIAAGAIWGFSNDYVANDVSVSGTTIIHTTTYVMPTMGAGTGNGALAGASGNVGLNEAAGVDNAQANNAALSAMNAGPVYGSAQTFSTQSSDGGGTISNMYVNASVGDGTLAGASGNIGVNIASGIGNVQANNLAASVTTTKAGDDTGGAVTATAQTDQKASMYGSGAYVPTAYLGSNALAGATGNVGVNIAAGIGNVQNNSLAISSVSVMK